MTKLQQGTKNVQLLSFIRIKEISYMLFYKSGTNIPFSEIILVL